MGCCGSSDDGGKGAGGKPGAGGKAKGASWKPRAPKGVDKAKVADFRKAQGETAKAVREALKGLENAPDKVPEVMKEYGDLAEDPLKIPEKMAAIFKNPLEIFDKIGVPKECLLELKEQADDCHIVEGLACGAVQVARGPTIESGMDKMVMCFKKPADKDAISEATGKEIFGELVFTYIKSVMEVLIEFVQKMLKKGTEAIAELALDKLYEVVKDQLQPLIQVPIDAIPDSIPGLDAVKKELDAEVVLKKVCDRHRKQFTEAGAAVAKNLTGKAVQACAILESGIARDCFGPWWKAATGGKPTASFAGMKKNMHGFERGLLKEMRTRLKTEELIQKFKAMKAHEAIQSIPECVGEGLVNPKCILDAEFLAGLIVDATKKGAASALTGGAGAALSGGLGGLGL